MAKKLSDIMLSEQIQNLSMLASMMDVERLKEFQKDFKDIIGQYEAIGIVDGHNYFIKLADMQARYKRLKTLIDFIDVSFETQKDIINKD